MSNVVLDNETESQVFSLVTPRTPEIFFLHMGDRMCQMNVQRLP